VVGTQYKSLSTLALAAPLLLLAAVDLCAAQQQMNPSRSTPSNSSASAQPNAAITLAEIVSRMVATHAQEVAQRRAYSLTRDYRIYEGEAKKPKSEITASVNFLPPQEKSFAILQSTGGMAEHMVRKALEREVELAHDPSDGQITTANYDFELTGEDSLNGKRCYVLELHPKHNTKDLLKGRLWVDAERFSIRQVEGEPAASPSWWVKNVHVVLTYSDVEGMWIQTGTQATAHIRMAGDYKMVSHDITFNTAETVSDLRRPSASSTSGGVSPGSGFEGNVMTRDSRRRISRPAASAVRPLP
jgi:outer membrane lipoprotein-sorting protein